MMPPRCAFGLLPPEGALLCLGAARRHKNLPAHCAFGFPAKDKAPADYSAGALRYKSLTMTYFHGCTSTIIGAKAFHGPVREGKAWGHLAMVVKHKGLPAVRTHIEGARAAGQFGKKHDFDASRMCSHFGLCIACVFERHAITLCPTATFGFSSLQGYRIKPHGQLVLVSCTHCCASTP